MEHLIFAIIQLRIKAMKTTVNKSAITGRFVSNATVARHPNTTFKQTVSKPNPKSGKK